MEPTHVVVVPSARAQNARKLLEEAGVWDRTRKLKRLPDGDVAIPITRGSITDCIRASGRADDTLGQYRITEMEMPASKATTVESPVMMLRKNLHDLLQGRLDEEQVQQLMTEVPHHWERHGDLVLLPESSFSSPLWQQVPGVWSCVVGSLGCCRLACRQRVSATGFRSPCVDLLLGNSGWVEQVDNHIRYAYDITKCMFSAGNITEKLRVASFPCQGETVLDLYAGIGYFTLPYLVHAGAAHVHACEWNPDAVRALEHNLRINGVADRCTVHPGDNRQLKLVSKVDRVNLGLIPSSEAGWAVACQALRSDQGGILHIHGNVSSKTEASSATSKASANSANSTIVTTASSANTPPTTGLANSADSTADSTTATVIPTAAANSVDCTTANTATATTTVNSFEATTTIATNSADPSTDTLVDSAVTASTAIDTSASSTTNTNVNSAETATTATDSADSTTTTAAASQSFRSPLDVSCEVGSWQTDALETREAFCCMPVLHGHCDSQLESSVKMPWHKTCSDDGMDKKAGMSSQVSSPRSRATKACEEAPDGCVRHVGVQGAENCVQTSTLEVSKCKLSQENEQDSSSTTNLCKGERNSGKSDHITEEEGCGQCLHNAHLQQTQPGADCSSERGSSCPSSLVSTPDTKETACSQEGCQRHLLCMKLYDSGVVARGNKTSGRESASWRQSGMLWASSVSARIKATLENGHGGQWRTSVLHIEHVKSYAPQIHHLVVDLDCRPQGQG